MTIPTSVKRPQITAHDLANYVVCPEAWRIKFSSESKRINSPRSEMGKQLRKEWVELSDLSNQLRKYTKIAYLLLVGLVVLVFIWENRIGGFYRKSQEISRTQFSNGFALVLDVTGQRVFQEILSLLVVLGLLIFMWDYFDRHGKAAKKKVGLDEGVSVIAAQGSHYLTPRTYQVEELNLLSRPHALVKEGGSLIPVDIQPLGKKVKDRHVIQLILHLKLMEIVEGTAPPYGILLMGPEKRVVKIKNSPEKQRWLNTLIEEMWSIIDGVPAVPAPSVYKCKGCDVRDKCAFSAYQDRP